MSRRLPALAVALGLALAASGAAAQTMTLRDRLFLVSSASTSSIAVLLSRNFDERFDGAQLPVVQVTGPTRALQVFCAGTGPGTPDLALSTRPMPRSVIETCEANGVTDIVEVRLGLGAVVLAVKRGDQMPGLHGRRIWEAVAAVRPADGELVTNRTTAWSEVDPALPATPIRLIVPERDTGTRALFEDLVLEGGCRNVREVRRIFAADQRRATCVTMRDDGRVRAMAAAEIPAALLASPAGTVGVIGYDQLVASGGNLVALKLDGMMPTPGTIASLEYEATQTFFLYAKRQHARAREGVGVVRGIADFLNEATSEQALGPGGYLTAAGLVPLAPAERTQQRRVAERQTAMSR